MQPTVVEFDECRPGALDLLFDDLLGEARKIGVPNPAAGETDERIPIARKRQLENDTQNTVIVILDLDVETFAAFEDQRLDWLDNRGTLKPDVSRGRVLEAGLLAAGSLS